MKEKFKTATRNLIPAYIIAFVSCFMLFLYEPINMYATNINDFWFDIYIMIKPTLLLALICFAIVCVLCTLIYFINSAFSKKIYLYKILVLLGFIFFIVLYIQGNFLIGNLPPLDGTAIYWDNYKTDGIISIAVWLIVSILVAVATYKFKYKKSIKICTGLCIVVFVMLTTSLISVLTKEGVFNKKNNISIATTKNFESVSTDKNFFIFLADAIDSKMFAEQLQDSKYKDVFKDFTYYPDTMSAYPFTRDSIPFILSGGVWNENETSFYEYSNKVLDESEFLKQLKQEGYDMNIYDNELIWNDDEVSQISNIFVEDKYINQFVYIRQMIKYIMFKYLPYQAKALSCIETMDFNRCKYTEEVQPFDWGNGYIYGTLVYHDELEKIDQKYFNFTHIEGGHVPFNFDEEMNYLGEKEGTYQQKLAGLIKVFNMYVNRLKENGVYDNSVIIIMSDHGYNFGNYIGRQNPILFIKGINEHHDSMTTSNIPISYEDLGQAYKQLLAGQTSDKLFNNIDPNRKRRYLLYEYTKEDHMVEYEQTGTADNEDTMIPTGREFNR